MGRYILPFIFSVLVDISPFGVRSHPILDQLTYKDHLTVQFIGSSILLSPMDGKIVEIKNDSSSYSRKTVISLQNRENSQMTVSLSSIFDSLYVKPNEMVNRGDSLAVLSNYTDSTYFLGIRTDIFETPVDPTQYFPALDYIKVILAE